MKRLIRWAARISGVEDDIRNETIERQGYEITQLAAWFCMEQMNVQNVLGILGWYMTRCSRIYHQEIREKYQRWIGYDFCRATKEKQEQI